MTNKLNKFLRQEMVSLSTGYDTMETPTSGGQHPAMPSRILPPCQFALFFYFFVCHSYPTALALIASGAVNVKPLVTHHFKLEQSLDAFETSRTGAGGAIKVVIHCNEGYQAG